MGAAADISRGHLPGRRVERDDTFLARRNQPVLQGEGHGADRPVTAHRQAAGGLDIEDRDVAILAQRRVEDRSRHRVMAARLEHQRAAHPIEAGEKILPARAHRRAPEERPAADHQPYRVAAGMAVDAGKDVSAGWYWADIAHQKDQSGWCIGTSIGTQLRRPCIRQSSIRDFSRNSRTSNTPAIASTRMTISPIEALVRLRSPSSMSLCRSIAKTPTTSGPQPIVAVLPDCRHRKMRRRG